MTSSHRRPVLVIALTLAAVLPVAAAVAAPAPGPRISADRACYVNTDPQLGRLMTITGSGYAPGHQVRIAGAGTPVTVTVRADGGFRVPIPAPVLAHTGPGTRRSTLTAVDVTTGGAPSASVVVRSANLAVATHPRRVPNVLKDKVTWTFSGFTPGKFIYGYYARRRIVAHTRFGRATGPCGTLRTRALLYPGGRPHSNLFTVTFESVSRYSRTAFPRVTGQLSILHF